MADPTEPIPPVSMDALETLPADVVAKLTEVFGSVQEGKRWLSCPAMGLNQQRPADLLTTPSGADMVRDLLTRLEYGVYT